MPDKNLLETFPTPSAKPYVIEHTAEEFTSLCPVTGQPDFGIIIVRYCPAANGQCVELKSLKLYLQSYREEGIFYEAVTNQICSDLAEILQPAWLQVITDWNVRGGIRSTIRAEYGDVPCEWKCN